jgi:hypothetical protein
MPTIYEDELEQYVRKLVLQHLGYQSHRDGGVEHIINRQPGAENDNPSRGDIDVQGQRRSKKIKDK